MTDSDHDWVAFGDEISELAATAADGLAAGISAALEGGDGKIETGVRLDLVVAALREAAKAPEADARRIVIFPYGAMTTALANLQGYPRLGTKRSILAAALESSMAALAPFMSLPPPLPRRSLDQDQRRAVRVCTRVPALYCAGERSFTGVVADVSTGGCFLETEDLLPVGSEARVLFVLPPGKEIGATAVVRWIRNKLDSWVGEHRPRYGMGLRFVWVAPEAEAALTEFVAREVEHAKSHGR